MTNQRMPDARKAELRLLAKHNSPVYAGDLAQALDEALDALEAADSDKALVQHKLDSLAKEFVAEQAAHNAAKRHLQAVHVPESGDVWFWQSDGANHPESLSTCCNVVMTADALRAILARAETAEARAADAASLERIRIVGMLRQLGSEVAGFSTVNDCVMSIQNLGNDTEMIERLHEAEARAVEGFDIGVPSAAWSLIQEAHENLQAQSPDALRIQRERDARYYITSRNVPDPRKKQ